MYKKLFLVLVLALASTAGAAEVVMFDGEMRNGWTEGDWTIVQAPGKAAGVMALNIVLNEAWTWKYIGEYGVNDQQSIGDNTFLQFDVYMDTTGNHSDIGFGNITLNWEDAPMYGLQNDPNKPVWYLDGVRQSSIGGPPFEIEANRWRHFSLDLTAPINGTFPTDDGEAGLFIQCFDPNYWNTNSDMYIMNVRFTGTSGRPVAWNPKPVDCAVDVASDVTLTWSSGPFAALHDVYFGTDFDDVNDANTLIYNPNNVYQGRQVFNDFNDFEPAFEYGSICYPLEFNTTYYWRIDEVNDLDPNSPWKGKVWSFTTIVLDECNGNGIPDDIDIASGYSQDLNGNGIPDECESDCNGNGVPDDVDIADGISQDLNSNGIPDECELDCNGNGIPDSWDIAQGTSSDCNRNGIPDECDIAEGTSNDVNGNGIPDECEPDCNGNGIPDSWDIAQGTSSDCNSNGVPDECDISSGTSTDENSDGIPDECQSDARIEPVVTTVDPLGTSEVRGALPESVSAVIRGNTYYVEVWASDIGETNTGLTSVYVDLSFCSNTSGLRLDHGGLFTTFIDGTIQSGGVDEFGGSQLDSDVGTQPSWVRIGWVEMSADVETEACTISLLPSDTGVSAYVRGLVSWAFVELGSVDLEIAPTAELYDLDDDGFIGPGDLSYFAGSWLQTVPPGLEEHDFDCDASVGVGDLSWFATGWCKNTDAAGILYPPCHPPCAYSNGKELSAMGIIESGDATSMSVRANAYPLSVDVAFELAVLDAPSVSDTTTVLPVSIESISAEATYYVEVWVSDVGDVYNTGLVGAYVDLNFPADAASVVNISHGGTFLTLPSGSAGAGTIDELGGSALPYAGVAPEWTRVAVVEMYADTAPLSLTFRLSPSSTGVSAYGRGIIGWDDISLGSVTIAEAVKSISGYVRTATAAGLGDLQVCANNNGGSDMTDQNGYYELEVPHGWSGTVTPDSEQFDLSFQPASWNYSNVIADIAEQNFTAGNDYDFDGDGKVNLIDFSMFVRNWLWGF